LKQPELLGDILSGSLDTFRETAVEIRAELEAIRVCPGPCEDGTVVIRAASGANRRAVCPVSCQDCAYGIRLKGELRWYIARIMTRLGVPRRHIENFSVCRESFAVSEASKWPVLGFLVLCGKKGTGKSFAAARVVYDYLEGHITDRLDRGTWSAAERAGDSVTWFSAKEIIDDADACAKAGISSLLVMDDLGREDEMKTARAILCFLVSKRYDAKLATVITTELSMADIRKRYGRYLTDRLAEDVGNGGCVVDCGDVSIRLEMARDRGVGS
jgi:hypothetical protein